MAITRVPTARPTTQKVNPTPKRTPVGVAEDGYAKQLRFREKRRPHSTFSAETSETNGRVVGRQVQ